METLLMLGILKQEQDEISLQKEMPSFGEAFVLDPEKQRSLEYALGMQWQKKETQIERSFGVEQYESTLLKKGNYELFLFGRTIEPYYFPYTSFQQYPVVGVALKVEF